ncbi:MAG: precorrin-2 C(20)-methyltransferase [Cyanobacteriota bacterium]|nr:precorrin-2 C(20)-methyltransferase [Cyanobacteriota bacterium]
MPNSPKPIGTLYGIGVGPGDPELITVKGARILERVPIVAFPAGIKGKPGVAENIIKPWLQPDQIRLPLEFPYVRDEATLQQAWQKAAARTWKYLESGEDVAFVSEGDVSFYSTFTYLAQTLQTQHPDAVVETIPGVCSPMAAAAELGLPLTVTSQRLVVLPALYNVAELERVLDWADVVVLMKVSSVYEAVWQQLQQRELLDRSYVIERATHPEQVVYRGLRDRPHLKLPYFSLLVVRVAPDSMSGESSNR